MATIRALSGDWSLSQGFRRYFSCCFASAKSKDGSSRGDVTARDQEIDSDDPKEKVNGDPARRGSYGSIHSAKSLVSNKSGKSTNSRKTNKSHRVGRTPRTEGDGAEIIASSTDPELTDPGRTQERREVVHMVPRNTQEGTSYAYDDQETSSDSDDEVLRHYQQSIQRVPSQRSIHSSRSQKSSASKVSKSSQRPGSSTDPDHSAATDPNATQTTSFIKSGDVQQADVEQTSSVHSISGSHRTAASVHADTTVTRDGATYANNAYVKDAGVVSPDQVSPTSTEQALSAYGEGSGSLGDHNKPKEHLFDVSDLQDREPVLISKCGNLEVTFEYDIDQSRMNITIHRALEIPSKDRGGANNTQVRTLLLPTKKLKHKTKVKQGENPEFMETCHFKIPSEEVGSMGVRFRLYGCERMRRERMIGEVILGFASLNLDSPTTHMLILEPRSNLSHGESKMDVSSLSRSDSASSTQSMQHGGMPELLIGLTYNGTTGRLSVEAIKGSNFKNMAMNRAPDTYVKLTLMSPNGQEIARSKTSIRRGQPNPLYKETFMFQVALFQLPDVTLMISVYNKKSMKRKEMIGWFSLGYSSSGEEEVSHWNDMRESKGEPVCRWHVLLEA